MVAMLRLDGHRRNDQDWLDGGLVLLGGQSVSPRVIVSGLHPWQRPEAWNFKPDENSAGQERG